MARPKKTDTTTEGTATESAADGSQPVKRGKRYPKNKTEAVKRAIRRLGPDAMPLDIVDWVWNKYKMEMDKSHVSTVKSTILKKMREEEGDTTVPTAEPVQEEEAYPDEMASLSFSELQTVKDVLSRIGPDRFRALPELFNV
jgi:hypothetical protein